MGVNGHNGIDHNAETFSRHNGFNILSMDLDNDFLVGYYVFLTVNHHNFCFFSVNNEFASIHAFASSIHTSFKLTTVSKSVPSTHLIHIFEGIFLDEVFFSSFAQISLERCVNSESNLYIQTADQINTRLTLSTTFHMNKLWLIRRHFRRKK